jgi:hypothetical protein
MGCTVDRIALAVELFEVTGEAVPENDPIVTGALFFSYKLGESGRLAEEGIREAALLASKEIADAGMRAALDICEAGRKSGVDSSRAIIAAEAASRAAAAAFEKMSADRTQLLKAVEMQMMKCAKLAGKQQSSTQDFRYVPVWYAMAAAVVGAVALSAALLIGIERNSAQANEAAVGRSFIRVLPALDSKLREQLMEHLRKKAG